MEPWQLLATKVSEISEDVDCAGWLMGIEFYLWAVVAGHYLPGPYGELPPEDVEDLRRLQREAGCWVMWDAGVPRDDDFLRVRPVSLEEWSPLYEFQRQRWREDWFRRVGYEGH